MKHVRHKDTGRRGWFVGSFERAAHFTDQAEVTYCEEPAGQMAPHYHTRCTETMLIVKGSLTCQGETYGSGDILVFEPGDINNCCLLETCTLVVVKVPAGGNDKVLV